MLNGRYGPYITDKARNAKIPKDRDPKSLTLDECQTLLAAAPARTFGKWGRKKAPRPERREAESGGEGCADAGARAGAAAKRAGQAQANGGRRRRLAAKGSKAAAEEAAPSTQRAEAAAKELRNRSTA